MDAEGFCFETEWPDTELRLKTALRRRRIPAPLIEDLVQDTGLRLLQKWEYVDPERGAWPLAYTVAMNILKDQLRAEERRQATVPPPPPAPFESDPEVMALARIELQRVRDALIQLSPAQRSALLAEVGECMNDERSSSAVKMLRLRARKRLKALTHEAPGVLGTLELLAQRVLERAGSITLPGGAALSAPLAAGLLSLGLITSQSSVSAAGSFPWASAPGTTVPSVSEEVARQVAAALAGAARVAQDGGTDDLVVAVRIAESAEGYRASSRNGGGGGRDDGTSDGGDHGGTDGDQPVTVPDLDDPLPPDGGPDGPPAPPVKVEESDAEAGPEGASAKAGASGGGHQGSVEVEVTPGGSGDSGGLPEAGGSVEVDGKKVVEIG